MNFPSIESVKTGLATTFEALTPGRETRREVTELAVNCLAIGVLGVVAGIVTAAAMSIFVTLTPLSGAATVVIGAATVLGCMTGIIVGHKINMYIFKSPTELATDNDAALISQIDQPLADSFSL